MTKKEFIEWNNKMCEKYNPHLFHEESNLIIKRIERKRKQIILDFLEANDSDTILEIGCGGGNIIKDIQKGKVFGIDISLFILNYAKKILNISKKLILCSAEKISFKNGIIDKIICSEVLEHTLEPDIIILESHRLLKKNGIFIVSIPNEKIIDFFKSIIFKIFSFNILKKSYKYQMSQKMTDEWHIHIFNLTEFEEVLKKSFVIVKKKAVPFSFVPIRIIYLCKKK